MLAGMTGILAIWNDCDPAGEQHFDRWYQREHLPERVGVPGFRFGRRYEAVWGDRRFFAYYEVDDVAVLSSPAYLARLDQPTPWTIQAMGSFRNMCRTVCQLACSAGTMVGSHALTLRLDGAAASSPRAEAMVRKLADAPGVARVQLWMAAAQQTPQTEEMRRRGGADAMIGGALVVECLRRRDAEHLAKEVEGPVAQRLAATGAELGLYALLCILDRRALGGADPHG